jgi:ureidoacrylate peracid hydrolase
MEFKDEVAPQNCAVILVDLQNDFCHPQGAWGKLVADPDLSKRVEVIRSFLPAARSLEVPVLFLRTIYNKWTISPPIQEWWQKLGTGPVCIEGSSGADFYQVIPEERDRVVNKYRSSGFMETDLDLTLRAKRCRQFSWVASEFGAGSLTRLAMRLPKIITCFCSRTALQGENPRKG